MSDEIKNEDVVEESPIVPAVLTEGEPVISEEMAEKYQEFVDTLKEKIEAEEVKPVVVEEPKDVITSGSQRPGKKSEEVAGITAVANGVIGTGSVKPKPKNVVKQQDKPEVEKVAIYSSKNVTWTNVGKVYRGYNIVTKDQADKWLTRDHVRIATPQEVAQEFGK